MNYIILPIFFLSSLSVALARPQYAVKRGIVSCTACHYSSAGGGTKNIFGKAVASHNLGRGRYSNQDLVSMDLRFFQVLEAHP
jgi:hypothetical protein